MKNCQDAEDLKSRLLTVVNHYQVLWVLFVFCMYVFFCFIVAVVVVVVNYFYFIFLGGERTLFFKCFSCALLFISGSINSVAETCQSTL